MKDVVRRAQGCLLGQLAGDSLGSLVEFQSAGAIAARYPGGPGELADGGAWNTIAGQPTDDSEMALMLARSILRAGRYDSDEACAGYAYWLGTAPFDVGNTTSRALGPALRELEAGAAPAAIAAAAQAAADPESQANGALMRVSPLGVYGHALPADGVARLAREDAALTHPSQVCLDANAVFVVAISHAIRTGAAPREVYEHVLGWARGGVSGASSAAAPALAAPVPVERALADPVLTRLELAASSTPHDFCEHQGWVLLALQNAFWQLLHAPDLEAGVRDTVSRGGDTDTNAAIAGALLGAAHGLDAVPQQWAKAVLACRPEKGRPGVRRPRPEPFWPVDALTVAEALAALGAAEPAL